MAILRPAIFPPPKLTPLPPAKMAARATNTTPVRRRLPILLFDVMDTIVRDPFYHDVPSFFGMSMKELLQAKHPTVWIEFEEGLIDELELEKRFFKDGRSFDLEGLKECMMRSYTYLEGMESLLHRLKENNYEIHAFTNYPIWYKLIEEKLKLSTYLSWTFCSCTIGKRKPSAEVYKEVVRQLDVEASNCTFVDDRAVNVEAAVNSGMAGIQFRSADALETDLRALGVNAIILPDGHEH